MAEGKKTNIFSNITPGGLLSGIGSIYTGIATFRAAGTQAEEMEYQGQMAMVEAFRDASIIREEGRDFAASQSLQFIGSGVELAGSALITMAQTRKYAETEAKTQEVRGEAQKAFAYRQAKAKRTEGRTALIGGIIKGAVSIFG